MAGCENDDCGGVDIRLLLASVPHLFPPVVALQRDQSMATHPGGLSARLLARNEQRNVQSHHLLLDEFKVLSANLPPATTRVLI